MPVKIYVAAPYSQKDEASAIADSLEFMGCSIVSRWHKPNTIQPNLIFASQEDIDDIKECEILILLDWSQSQGKHFETGYAYQLGKKIIWWHEDKLISPVILASRPKDYEFPIFSYLPEIANIYSWDSLFEALGESNV